MSKEKDYTKVANEAGDKLVDNFGTAIEIGDVVVGAKTGRWGDTDFSYMIVMGRTTRMLKVRKIGIDMHQNGAVPTKERILQDIELGIRSDTSPKNNGAVVAPWNVLSTKVNMVSPLEIQSAMDRGKKKLHVQLDIQKTSATNPWGI